MGKCYYLEYREYLAKGLPIITACQIDILPSGCEFIIKILSDETLVDIKETIEFYNNIYKHGECRSQINERIWKFARDKCEMKIALQLNIEYINNREDR